MNDPAYSRKTFWQEEEYLFEKIPVVGRILPILGQTELLFL